MKAPPRVRRVVAEEARMWDAPWRIVDWGRADSLYIAIYAIGPRPHSEETEVTQFRYIVFERTGRVRYSGIHGYKYDWRKDSENGG